MAIQPSTANDMAIASQTIMDILGKNQQMDKVQALLKLLEVHDIKISVAGQEVKILNQLLTTEMPNVNYTKTLTKNESWRFHVQEVFHLPHIDDEKIVGSMDTHFVLNMIPLRRKRAQEIVNGLKNDVAGAEVIPSNVKRKRFFGLM